MKVHILELDNNQTSINRLTAAIGFEELSYSIQWFTPCDFERIQLQFGDIVVGGINFAQKAMDRLGIDVPTLDTVPTSLLPFARRKIQASTMGEVRALVSNGTSIFAKPFADQTKRFDGTLFQSVRDLIPTSTISDDEVVLVAEPIEFISEYRVFVQDKNIVGVRHYKGDPLVFPEPETIHKSIDTFSNPPKSYALDIGVTSSKNTAVVEINDAYASACYGLPAIRYARFILARWQELYAKGR